MTQMRLSGLLAALLIPASLGAQVAARCDCDPARPETMKQRQCSLCNEAEKQPAGASHFVLKDINPRKPNRWLVLPRHHKEGAHPLHEMNQEDRTALWTAAIQKAEELFGDDWALAYNGDRVRTQCHTHIHIGRFIKEIEMDNFVVVDGPGDIPVPEQGGVWVHPVNGKLHVHTGEELAETVLLR